MLRNIQVLSLKNFSKRALGFTLLSSLIIAGGCSTTSNKIKTVTKSAKKKAKAVSKSAKVAEWKDLEGNIWAFLGHNADWTSARKSCDMLYSSTKAHWRLPSKQDIFTAKSKGILSSRNKAFGWEDVKNAWTIELEAGPTGINGVYVSLADQRTYRTELSEKISVFCVRPDKVDKNLSYWRDFTHGMDWFRAPYRGNYHKAEEVCTAQSERTKQRWNVPSQKNLIDAIKSGIQTPKNKAFGKDMLDYTWTSRIENKLGSNKVFVVDLRNKREFLQNIDHEIEILCVRNLSH